MARKSEKIKIGHITYRLKYTRGLKLGSANVLGRIHYEGNEIELNFDLGNRYWDTLFHEIAHGIQYFLGTETPESKIEQMANMWLMVLVENKWIMRKLLKEKRDARGGK
jgi:hypothetical protein